MPSSRYAPWLGAARRYFEHRAACAVCRGGSTTTCDSAQRLRRSANGALRATLETPERDADVREEAAS